MLSSYRAQDLIDQNTESIVHRVGTEDGVEFMLTSLKLTPGALAGLFGEGVFEGALARLRWMRHEDLREVTEGGMDGEDGSPWVRSLWLEGKALSEQNLEEKDIRRLGNQCQRLMEDMGRWADTVSFDPAQILTLRTPDGELHSLFSVDYFRWFRDAAEGHSPGTGQNTAGEVRKLLEALMVKQLKPPKKEREGTPIPFREERSPALTAYQAPQTRWLLSTLGWLGFVLTLGVITWLTFVGMKRVAENPRQEVPAWNAPNR